MYAKINEKNEIWGCMNKNICANLEIERKYIIIKPDICELEALPGYRKSEILQIYLDSPAGVTHRIRKRSCGENTVYTETVKTRVDKMSSNEFEREIGKDEFSSLRKEMKHGTRELLKTRHVFMHGERLLEVDVYPEWERTCILEIELEDRDETVKLPDQIKLVREVTGDFSYSNASMSHVFPKEDMV